MPRLPVQGDQLGFKFQPHCRAVVLYLLEAPGRRADVALVAVVCRQIESHADLEHRFVDLVKPRYAAEPRHVAHGVGMFKVEPGAHYLVLVVIALKLGV